MAPRSANRQPAPPEPAVPEAAVRDAKVGGTVALLCAAAISAQTLFQLGRLLGLSAWTAWLLPAALDVYAITSARVAFQVPVGHKARKKAIWNARCALTFTVASNSLFHALFLAKGHHGWTPSDWALVAVSALPPIVVERLLHLQSIVNSAAVATTPDANPDTAKPVDKAPANDNANPVPPPTAPPIDKVPVANAKPALSPPRPRPVANPGGDSPTGTEALVAATEPVYRQLLATTGRRPTAPQLVDAVDGLNTPSRAKQIREEIEARFPELAPAVHLVPTPAAAAG